MLISLSIGVILLATGFIQGLTGFGMGLAAMPLLCLFLEVQTAVPLVTLSSVVITTTLTVQLRTDISFSRIAPFCVAAIPGILLGATILKSADSTIMRMLLGLLLIFYSLYSLIATPRPRSLHRFWPWPTGFVAGLIGASLSTGGPPIIIYTTLTDWSKDQIKATLTGFFMFTSIMSATTHALTGITTLQTVIYFFVSIPFLLVGVLGGSFVYRRIPSDAYRKIILLGLILMGLIMIIL
ncbi:MAG: sulfite exporter TauE/SafE family protein [Desulfocapsaceae bacterium]